MPWLWAIPPHLLDPAKKQEFLEWLILLPVDIWTKKHMYKEWCEHLGLKMVEEDVQYLTGGRAFETRG